MSETNLRENSGTGFTIDSDGTFAMQKVMFGEQTGISTYTEYLEAMDALKKADNEKAFDYYEPKLSENERKVDDKLQKCRDALIKDKYVYAPRDLTDGPSIYPPIRPFYEVREIIDNDPAFKIFQALPKGGNLHIHTSATLEAAIFVDMLCAEKAINSNIAVYLGTDESKYKKYTLAYFTSGKVPEGFCFLLTAILDKKITRAELVDMLTFSTDRIKNVKYAWDEFNNIFARVSFIMKVKTIFEMYYKKAFEKLFADNVDYVELRFGPTTLVDNNNDLLSENTPLADAQISKFPDGSANNSIESIRNVYYDFRSQQGNGVFKLKLILSGSRKSKDISDAVHDMNQTAIWKKNYKDVDLKGISHEFIIGYDLVSEEDRGYKTDDYAKAIFDNKISIPFYFHDGESCWADDDNLFSAYLLSTKRVGHGINLFHFPALLENIRQNSIALEVCPISNQLLRYTQDLRVHPIGEYLKRGIQCVICSDDPQIFNYSGLSYDFWEVYYSQLLDLRSIKKLIKNSYYYGGMDNAEYITQLEQWTKKWDACMAKLAQ